MMKAMTGPPSRNLSGRHLIDQISFGEGTVSCVCGAQMKADKTADVEDRWDDHRRAVGVLAGPRCRQSPSWDTAE